MIVDSRTTDKNGILVLTLVSDAPDQQAAEDEIREYSRLHHLMPSASGRLTTEGQNSHRVYVGLAYTTDAIVELGQRIYACDIKPIIEADNIGKVVAIDVETGQFEFGDDEIVAAKRILDRWPNAVIYFHKAGYLAISSLAGAVSRDDASWSRASLL